MLKNKGKVHSVVKMPRHCIRKIMMGVVLVLMSIVLSFGGASAAHAATINTHQTQSIEKVEKNRKLPQLGDPITAIVLSIIGLACVGAASISYLGGGRRHQ